MALRYYRRRMWIEEIFGDMKKHGLDLEGTMLRKFSRLSRLTLTVACLYISLISVGSRTIHQGFVTSSIATAAATRVFSRSVSGLFKGDRTMFFLSKFHKFQCAPIDAPKLSGSKYINSHKLYSNHSTSCYRAS